VVSMSKHLTPEDLEQIGRVAEIYAIQSAYMPQWPEKVGLLHCDIIALAKAYLQLYREKLDRDSEVSRVRGAGE